MKIAFVGMGKLGFPCALAAASRGHDVVGYDVSPAAYEILKARKYPHREERAQELLDETELKMVGTVGDIVAHAEIIFVAVQTPHQPEFEGLTRMPEHRADFDYSALVESVHAVAHEALVQKKPTSVAIISTALPGTCEREIYPLLNDYVGLVYNPFFIAMGTTIADYLKPEFVLLGHDPERDKVNSLERVQNFYRELHGGKETTTVDRIADKVAVISERRQPPHAVMSIPSAEATKVFYNVFLGMKIIAANAQMEICHKVGANCDDVTKALALATDRVVSSKYMRGGMGDGGGCHPRDQIALSYLAQELDLSYDIFESMVRTREAQTEWLAYLCFKEAKTGGYLPIVILGKAYKKGTNLTFGSPAILLKNILDELGVEATQWDPHVDDTLHEMRDPATFVIATDHDEFFRIHYPKGSVVIDPWGKLQDLDHVKVIRVGRAGALPRSECMPQHEA